MHWIFFLTGLKCLLICLLSAVINKCAYSVVHMVAADLHTGYTPYPGIHSTLSFCKI